MRGSRLLWSSLMCNNEKGRYSNKELQAHVFPPGAQNSIHTPRAFSNRFQQDSSQAAATPETIPALYLAAANPRSSSGSKTSASSYWFTELAGEADWLTVSGAGLHPLGSGWGGRSVPGRRSGYCAGVEGKGYTKPNLRPPALPAHLYLLWALPTASRPAFPTPVYVWARPPRGAGRTGPCT